MSRIRGQVSEIRHEQKMDPQMAMGSANELEYRVPLLGHALIPDP